MKKANRFIFILLSCLIMSAVLFLGYMENMKSDIADNLLRLHIIGADDSEYAQTLKICVRDRILSDFSDIFSECGSLEESAAKAEEYKTRIESAAKDELLRHGCDDSVTASVEDCRFPTKNYGDISLPGGVYTALNIRIGKASGRNWWCVMYPPLCINNGNAVISEESRNKLKAVLSPDEYRLITSGEQPDIKIKFKIAEVLGRCFR